MTDALDAAPAAGRRRRADARRSVDAIVSAARTLFGDRPDTSVEEVAAAAGLTRQTVYAHFPTRDALVVAVINAERADGVAALEAAGLDDLSPVDALRRFLEISWEIVERSPLALDPVLAKTPGPDGSNSHALVGSYLERIIERGRDSGDFDRVFTVRWLAAMTFGLGHTAAEEVAAGHHTISEVQDTLVHTVLRLYGAGAPRRTDG